MRKPDNADTWRLPDCMDDVEANPTVAEQLFVDGRGRGQGWWLEAQTADWVASSLGYEHVEARTQVRDYEVDVVALSEEDDRVLVQCMDWNSGSGSIPARRVWRAGYLALWIGARPVIVSDCPVRGRARRAVSALDIPVVPVVDVLSDYADSIVGDERRVPVDDELPVIVRQHMFDRP